MIRYTTLDLLKKILTVHFMEVESPNHPSEIPQEARKILMKENIYHELIHSYIFRLCGLSSIIVCAIYSRKLNFTTFAFCRVLNNTSKFKLTCSVILNNLWDIIYHFFDILFRSFSQIKTNQRIQTKFIELFLDIITGCREVFNPLRESYEFKSMNELEIYIREYVEDLTFNLKWNKI